MDSLNHRKQPSRSNPTKTMNRKRKAKNSSNTSASKRPRFYASFSRHQSWSLPDSIMYYISKNPSSSKVYQKLAQTCKYFYMKNPIIVFDEVCFGVPQFPGISPKTIDVENISSKIWITNNIEANLDKKDFNKFSTMIIPKFYRVDVMNLNIAYQNITFNEFLFLSSNVQYCSLYNTAIKDDDNDSNVPFEKLVKVLPKLKHFALTNTSYITNPNYSSFITSNTVKELLELPHFSKIHYISLSPVSQEFDIETLFTHIKNNKCALFNLYFCGSFSEDYENCLESIVQEIIASEGRNYQAPVIYSSRVSESQFKQLIEFSNKYFYKKLL